jgi:hypothetical protein
VLIVNCIPETRGWSPIQHMVALCSELMESSVLTIDETNASTIDKVLAVLWGRSRRGNGRDSCLLICAGPADLGRILQIKGWRKRFRFVAVWIIDSFWLNHVPTVIRLSHPFDHIFVTSGEDVDNWENITRASTSWLPWGTDALRLGRGVSSREWDITRVGRQPPEWDDDIAAAGAAEAMGIKYQGRPPGNGMNNLQNQKYMMGIYGNSKYLLAFSNSVNPELYTHPTRQYLTGRWVDALGGGSIVAGVAPQGPSIDALLWPGATLDLGGIRRNDGLEVLAAALRKWTPGMAAVNYAMALRNLDWRWRFKVLADTFGINPVRLADELKLLKQLIDASE